MQAKASFTLDKFDNDAPYCEQDGVAFARAHIDKTFRGDIEGNSRVEMLSARAARGGAGYVALERIEASVGGRRGSFALLHIGTMSSSDQWAKWPIVPGSGAGELASIRGEGRIDIAADGSHSFTLDYELD